MEWYQWLSIAGIPSIISGIMVWAIQRGQKSRDEMQEEIRKQTAATEAQNVALMKGMQALLRDRLLTGYRHYFEKGWAEYDDRENIENLYRQYHALGENGVMDGYRAKFLALPITRAEKKEEKENA